MPFAVVLANTQTRQTSHTIETSGMLGDRVLFVTPEINGQMASPLRKCYYFSNSELYFLKIKSSD
jgi:hypothetical protein